MKEESFGRRRLNRWKPTMAALRLKSRTNFAGVCWVCEVYRDARGQPRIAV
jgi:hypothetical protein